MDNDLRARERAAEKPSQETDVLLRDIIGSIAEGLAIFDAEDRLVIFNESYRALLPEMSDYIAPGVRYEDILRAGLARRHYADAIGRDEEWLAERLEEHRRPTGASEYRLSDGRRILVTKRRIRNGWTSSLRVDISALKAAQTKATGGPETLSEEQLAAGHRFRLVVEAAPNGMIMVDAFGRIMMLNNQMERMFGYAELELLGQPVEILVPQRFRAAHQAMRNMFVAEPVPRLMGAGRDLFGLRKDGIEFPVEIGLNPIEAEQGWFVVASVVDVSARKKAEADLRESESRLQELHTELLHVSRLNSMGQMAATLAHELNQPLTAISNYMEAIGALLGRGNPPVDRLRLFVERAGEQAARAAQVIRRLQQFVSRGDTEKRIEALPRLLKEAQELALLGTKQRGVSIRLEDVPEVYVMADKIQIQQVLLNLLRNATEAVAAQDNGTVTMGAVELDDGSIEISVADTGPGLPEEVRARLFQPFVSTKKTGMGMGLSICHAIVTAHNGRIWVDTNAGTGTVFHVALPGVARAEADICRE